MQQVAAVVVLAGLAVMALGLTLKLAREGQAGLGKVHQSLGLMSQELAAAAAVVAAVAVQRQVLLALVAAAVARL